MCVCLLVGIMPVATLAGQYDQVINLTDGQTYNVSNFNQDVCTNGHESLVEINSAGTYTLTGVNPSRRTSGRVQINADCTLILDNLTLNNMVQLNEDKSYYLGGTKGAIEVADGVTVNIVLQGSNKIDCTQFYTYGAKCSGILLGFGSKIIISGNGQLAAHSIARVFGTASDAGRAGYLTIKSGLLSCSFVGNQKINSIHNSGTENSALNIILNYEGGSFYSSADDSTLSTSQGWNTRKQAMVDTYRIRIPASGVTNIKRGADGEYTQTQALNGYVYAWVDIDDFIDNTPIVFYVQSDAGYHRYEASYVDGDTFLVDAVLSESTGNIGGVYGTLKDSNNKVYAGSKITFTGENGMSTSATVATDGSYSCGLPKDNYKVTAEIDGNTYNYGTVSVTTDAQIEYNITLSALSGKLKDASGKVYSNATVTYNKAGETFSCTTDENGNYNALLPVGNYTINLLINGNAYSGGSYSISSIQTGTHNITLLCINGKITDSNNAAMESAQVQITVGSDVKKVLTDSQGNYSAIYSVGTNNSFNITVTKLGYSSQTKTGNTFSQTGLASVNFKLESVAISGSAEINSESDLVYLGGLESNSLDGVTIVLKNDIALSDSTAFSGFNTQSNITFEGQDHQISNLKCPLFTSLNGTNAINNLHLSGDIASSGYVGSFATAIENLTLTNCSFIGSVSTTASNCHAGGMVGFLSGSKTIKLINCAVQVHPHYPVGDNFGGVVGYGSEGDIYLTNSYVKVLESTGDKTEAVCGIIMGSYSAAVSIYVDNSYVTSPADTAYKVFSGPGNGSSYDFYQTGSGLFYNSTTTTDTNYRLAYATAVEQSKMTAISGTEGALVDKLNANVTSENGYNKWYIQPDGYPGFDEYYNVSVTGGVIDDTEVSSMMIKPGETVTVNASYDSAKQKLLNWEVTSSSAVLSPDSNSETVSFVMPEENVTIKANYFDYLIFTDNDSYDIPWNTVGTAIKPVDVSAAVSGGTAPYHYSLVNAPDWLTISSSGVISGTSTAVSEYREVKIIVTDSGTTEQSSFITIKLGGMIAEEPALNSDGYYEITNADELFWFAGHVNLGNTTSNAKLMNDIDLNPGITLNADGTYSGGTPIEWTPIGMNVYFKGIFDGNGYEVSGMYIIATSDYYGFFRRISGTTTKIENLTVNGSMLLKGADKKIWLGFVALWHWFTQEQQ